MLLKSLVIIGALTGLMLGCIGTSVPWLFPQAFSPDAEVIKEVCSPKLHCYIAGKGNIQRNLGTINQFELYNVGSLVLFKT